jgi:ferrous iron transport protein B
VISQGIIPGIGGILIFIPQIAFLFMFISILEESGYMSRVVFLMDKIMRKFGLSGKVWCRLFLELPVLFLL